MDTKKEKPFLVDKANTLDLARRIVQLIGNRTPISDVENLALILSKKLLGK